MRIRAAIFHDMPKAETLQFAKATLFFYDYPYVNFARLENRERFYDKLANPSPFSKTVLYKWGHADFVKEEIIGKGHIAVVAREAGLLMTTNSADALNDIELITITSGKNGPLKRAGNAK